MALTLEEAEVRIIVLEDEDEDEALRREAERLRGGGSRPGLARLRTKPRVRRVIVGEHPPHPPHPGPAPDPRPPRPRPEPDGSDGVPPSRSLGTRLG